jgi:hypothetical protein
MPDDNPSTARRLIAEANRAVLATRLPDEWPYASLVLVAPDGTGLPLLLLSDLAEHTKNLKREPRASLLFDGTAGMAQPLEGARLTLLGRIERAEEPAALASYVAKHPDAANWARMSDFHLYRLRPARAHLVAGFGRIAWIDAAEIFP